MIGIIEHFKMCKSKIQMCKSKIQRVAKSGEMLTYVS